MERSSVGEKKKGKTNVYFSSDSNDSLEDDQTRWPKMGAMRLLNTIKAQVEESKMKNKHATHLNDWVYIEIKLNGHWFKVMIGSRASYNFISKEITAKLNLSMENSLG